MRTFYVAAGLALASGWTAAFGNGMDLERMLGTWESEGYGRVLEISENTVHIFDVTEISCVHHESMSRREFLDGYNRIDLSDPERFSFYYEGGITRYDYRRLPGLPARCTAAIDAEPDFDPELNFEVFWRAFGTHYAFFDVRNVDWDAVYDTWRPRITADTSNDELFAILTGIVDRIDDRHVLVEGDGYPRHYSGHPGTLAKLLEKEIPAGEEQTRPKIIARARPLIAKEYLGDTRKQAGNGQFTWGWAAEGVGYFSIDSMEQYTEPGATLRDSHRLVDEIMDRVIEDLESARGIIVDARWNGGGYDSNALHIAGHFTDRQLIAFSKRAKNGDGFNPWQEIFIPWHARKRYTGLVVYLCGRDTLSAAEIFSMAMMAIPNATSLGEPTVGSLSDTHSIYLPNGWRMQISNEEYRAIDGVVYEGLGIPVDVELPPLPDATFDSYLRAVMDAAIARIDGR